MHEQYASAIDRFRTTAVLVVGDVMLDEYLCGEATRVCPEAPVPVIEIQKRYSVPGGAANVAANVASLGGRALLCSLTGEDTAARQLSDLLLAMGVDNRSLATCQRPTSTKTRIVAQGQQIVRFDHETRRPIDDELEAAVLQRIAATVAHASAIVISDYGKGLITPTLSQHIIALARSQSKPVVIDPKGHDYRHYRGATIVTPNKHEALTAAGVGYGRCETVNEIAAELHRVLEESAVLITQGADGMTLFQQGTIPQHFPAQAVSIFDVTGAGDTVIATLALGLGAGMSFGVAAELATAAAGIVVGKPGTATASVAELSARMHGVAAPCPSQEASGGRRRFLSGGRKMGAVGESAFSQDH